VRRGGGGGPPGNNYIQNISGEKESHILPPSFCFPPVYLLHLHPNKPSHLQQGVGWDRVASPSHPRTQTTDGKETIQSLCLARVKGSVAKGKLAFQKRAAAPRPSISFYVNPTVEWTSRSAPLTTLSPTESNSRVQMNEGKEQEQGRG
jgi:hypothetical protein